MVELIEEREFGFILEHTESRFMRRYVSFWSEHELEEYITRTRPLDCYVSVAYYDFPRERKDLKGADLFFDLDCAENPRRARADAETVYEVLLDDFGAEQVVMNFSGAKGYHVIYPGYHTSVMCGMTYILGRNERREIADYMTGKYDVSTLDTPASCDTSRLRRLEGTINSKTGERCRRVKASF